MGLVYIYTYIYHKKSTIHVGKFKYTSPMDSMGNNSIEATYWGPFSNFLDGE